MTRIEVSKPKFHIFFSLCSGLPKLLLLRNTFLLQEMMKKSRQADTGVKLEVNER